MASVVKAPCLHQNGARAECWVTGQHGRKALFLSSQIASAELKLPEVLVQCFRSSTRTQGSSGDPVIQRAEVWGSEVWGWGSTLGRCKIKNYLHGLTVVFSIISRRILSPECRNRIGFWWLIEIFHFSETSVWDVQGFLFFFFTLGILSNAIKWTATEVLAEGMNNRARL